MHLRRALTVAAAIIAFQPFAVFSATCPNLTLETILTRATSYMNKGAARSAVDELYEPCSSADSFLRGSVQLKERFLFEYVDACIQASHRRGIQQDTRQEFLQQGIVAAKQYMDWYHTLESESQLQLSRSQRRIWPVVHNLLELYIETNQRSQVLDTLEEIAQQSPEYVGPPSAELWEEHLKLDSEFKNRRSDAEIAKVCQDDNEYSLRWKLFREFLRRASDLDNMALTVRRIEARNIRITCGELK